MRKICYKEIVVVLASSTRTSNAMLGA